MTIGNLLPSRLARPLIAHSIERRLVRGLIILTALLIPAVLGYMASIQQLKIVALLLAGVGATIVLMRWPALGIVFLGIVGMVFPSVGPSGLNLSMLLVALLSVIWLFDMFVRRKEARLVAARANWPLFALVAVAIISFVVGQLNSFAFVQHAPLGAQAGGLAIVILSAAAFFLVANLVSDLRWLKAITWAFLAYSVLEIIVRILPASNAVLAPLVGGDFGSIFWIWLTALAFAQAAFNYDLDPRWRVALGGIVIAALYIGLALSFRHKSLWLPQLVSLAAILTFRSWRIGLVLVVVGVPVALYGSSLILDSETYSASTRLDAFRIVADMVKGNPLFGVGFANYYWNTPLYNIRGWNVEFSTHNNYLDIVAQMGIFGLLAFLWFFGEVGRLGLRLRERVTDGFSRAYVYGSLGALVATLVTATLADWVLPFFYNIGMYGFRTSVLVWLFLGGLVSLKHMTSADKKAQGAHERHQTEAV